MVFDGSVGIEQFLMRNIRQKQYSQFPPVHVIGKPWWGMAYVQCMTNLQALYAWVLRWHVSGMLSLVEHWQGQRALSNHVCAHSVICLWHVVYPQHLVRACSEQSRSTSVLPINHVIQMPQCLSGFVNHGYWVCALVSLQAIWNGIEWILIVMAFFCDGIFYIQLSAIITRSNISWYYIQHCNDNSRT